MFYADSHNHDNSLAGNNIKSLTCALNKKEALSLIEEKRHNNNIYISYGIHPLYIKDYTRENMDFMERLCSDKVLSCVGECGFDLYTKESKATLEIQKKIFDFQLELAVQYDLPLVIHNLKAFDCIMQCRSRLKNVKAVYFHAWAFTYNEALSLLNHGINAYFGFGKSLINDSRKALLSFTAIPLERILLETDSPYQLKGCDITKVYDKACCIKNMDMEEFSDCMERNFNKFLDLQNI